MLASGEGWSTVRRHRFVVSVEHRDQPALVVDLVVEEIEHDLGPHPDVGGVHLRRQLLIGWVRAEYG